MKVVHFRPTRQRTSKSWLIFGAMSLILGLTAIVLPDSSSVELLRIENSNLKERKSRALSRAYSSSVPWDAALDGRTRDAAKELDSLFPGELSALDFYETLQFAAALNDLEIVDLNIGEAQPTLFATASFPLGSRKASLRGRASLTELRSFLGDLRSLAVPLTVQSFELTSETSSETSSKAAVVFALRLVLYNKLTDFQDANAAGSRP